MNAGPCSSHRPESIVLAPTEAEARVPSLTGVLTSLQGRWRKGQECQDFRAFGVFSSGCFGRGCSVESYFSSCNFPDHSRHAVPLPTTHRKNGLSTSSVNTEEYKDF
jgi:hypothetical protein